MTSAQYHLTIAKSCATVAKSHEAAGRADAAQVERAAEARHRKLALELTPGR